MPNLVRGVFKSLWFGAAGAAITFVDTLPTDYLTLIISVLIFFFREYP